MNSELEEILQILRAEADAIVIPARSTADTSSTAYWENQIDRAVATEGKMVRLTTVGRIRIALGDM